jgi:hypothetical protein
LLLVDEPYAELTRLWDEGHLAPANEWLAAAAVNHLLTISDEPAWVWADRLPLAESFESWLLAGGIPPATFLGEWLAIAYDDAGGAGGALVVRAGAEPPAGRLLTLCRTESSADLYALAASDSWQPLLSIPSASDADVSLTPLPGQRGAVVEQVPRGGGGWETLVWRDGRVAATYAGADARTQLAFSGRVDPAGNRLVMISRDEDRGFLRFDLLDLERCSGGECALNSADGLPVWSPDGQRTLVVRGSSLDLGDGAGDVLPEPNSRRGGTPFWLSDDVFGYLRVLRVGSERSVLTAENGIFVQTAAGGAAQVGVEERDLLAAFPAGARPASLFIEYAAAHPSRPDTLLVVAVAPAREAFHLFVVTGLLDVAYGRSLTGATIVPAAVLDMLPTHLQVAPGDSGWVAVRGVAADKRELGVVRLLNIDTGATTRHTTYFGERGARSYWLDWSPDGTWVSIVGAGMIQWIEAAGEGRIWVNPPAERCSAAVWISDP